MVRRAAMKIKKHRLQRWLTYEYVWNLISTIHQISRGKKKLWDQLSMRKLGTIDYS